MLYSSIELFSGTGGLALGLQQSGFDHRALFEWDKDSCDNIKANIQRGFPLVQHWNVIQTDVRLVHYDEYGNNIKLVAGGPPCQPFSLGGKHQAYNDKRDMFPEAVRAVRELQPQAFIFENVKGLLRKSFSTYFSYIILQLSHPEVTIKQGMTWLEHLKTLEECHTSVGDHGLSYNVVFRLVNAADYGVPQSRHRVIIVGFRNDLNANWSFPEPTHTKEALLYSKYIDSSYWEEHKIAKASRPCVTQHKKDNIIRSFDKSERGERWQTVRDAIKGLPDPRSEKASRYANHEFRDGARPYAGHSGSVLDEPSKTIKAGAHGCLVGKICWFSMMVLCDTTQYVKVRGYKPSLMAICSTVPGRKA